MRRSDQARQGKPERPERRVVRAEAGYGAGPPFAPVGVVEQVNWIPLEARDRQPERWDGMA